jgi:hypothetical protein
LKSGLPTLKPGTTVLTSSCTWVIQALKHPTLVGLPNDVLWEVLENSTLGKAGGFCLIFTKHAELWHTGCGSRNAGKQHTEPYAAVFKNPEHSNIMAVEPGVHYVIQRSAH